MSTWSNVSTWGCPCRKGVLPQTWASGGGCSGWSGREWSFQRVPTLPAAICGTWSVQTLIANLLMLFQVVKYIQGMKITCRISLQLQSRNICKVIKKETLWRSECWVPTLSLDWRTARCAMHHPMWLYTKPHTERKLCCFIFPWYVSSSHSHKKISVIGFLFGKFE